MLIARSTWISPRIEPDVSILYRPTPVPFTPHDPSWRQPLHLHFRPLYRALSRALGELEGRVLDIGCGMQPYRALLGSRVSEYVGVDREGPLSKPTVVADADALPFESSSFDAVMSTQVFEHLREPEAALRESARVLRRRGRIVLTVPGVWPTHEAPHDYWRFTRHGLEQSFARAGFADVRIEALGGLWATVGQMINLELQRARYARELVPLVNLAAGFLEKRGPRHEDLALAWLVTGTRTA
jgi:SAM-dependent methyltransferase